MTNEHLFPHFNNCADLVYHSQISETELIGLYRSASAFIVVPTSYFFR